MPLWNILVYNYKSNLKVGVGEDEDTRIKVHQIRTSDNLHLHLFQRKPQTPQSCISLAES